MNKITFFADNKVEVLSFFRTFKHQILKGFNMWYNYHAQIKKLILEGRLIGYQFLDDYNGISPALVLYFSDHRPMPIRDYMWERYLPYLMSFEEVNN